MRSFSSLLLLVLVFAVSPSFAAEANQLSAREKADGWKLLFDGKSLQGWRGYKTPAVGTGWKVQDGALVLNAAKTGDLVTTAAYADFELIFEWKIAEGGNSGVFYRAGLGDSGASRSAPEYQVLDNEKAKDNKLGNHLAGALYDLGNEVPRNLPKPVGQWNQGRVIVKGWQVEHWLNGQKVITADLASPAGKTLIAASKFKDWPTFAAHSQGHIALQDHGDVVSYRNIKLRDLK